MACPSRCQGRIFGAWKNCPHGWRGRLAEIESEHRRLRLLLEALEGENEGQTASGFTSASPPTPHEAVREGLREIKAGKTVTEVAEKVIRRREAEQTEGGER